MEFWGVGDICWHNSQLTFRYSVHLQAPLLMTSCHEEDILSKRSRGLEVQCIGHSAFQRQVYSLHKIPVLLILVHDVSLELVGSHDWLWPGAIFLQSVARDWIAFELAQDETLLSVKAWSVAPEVVFIWSVLKTCPHVFVLECLELGDSSCLVLVAKKIRSASYVFDLPSLVAW